MDMKNFLAQEVKPSFGCTEPGAVALAAAKAAKALELPVEHMEIALSLNVFKNGRSVGLPGLPNLRGNVMAAALGALGGNPEQGLMVLHGISDAIIAKAQALIDAGKVTESITPDVPPVWERVTVHGGGHTAHCTNAHRHDRIEELYRDDTCLFQAPPAAAQSVDALYEEIRQFSIQDLWNFASSVDAADEVLLLEGARMNMAVADASQHEDWGMGSGLLDEDGHASLADQIRNAAAGASEVRMSGGDFPVMSSAGSGNHGITAIVPVVVAARGLKCSERQLAESLALSHLVCGFLKAHTGRLTPVCGCAVAAGAGAAAGLVRLQGGTAEQAERAVVTFVASLLGMLCDGAKETCSLKVGTAAAEAWNAASLAIHGGGLRENQGLSATSLHETGEILDKFSHGLFQVIDQYMTTMMLQQSGAEKKPTK